LAFGGVDFDFLSEDDASNITDLSSDDIETGFVVGGGVEHKFSDSWSVKLEYQYIDFGEIEVSGVETPSGDPVSAEMDLSFHTARIGLNYQF
jgi:outer membrane immunogenic protein